jgi:hypothetical protein
LVVLKWCVLEKGNQELGIMNQGGKNPSLRGTEGDAAISQTVLTKRSLSSQDDKRREINESQPSPVILNDSEESKAKQDSSAKPQNDNSKFLYQLIDAIKHDNAQIAGLLRGCSVQKMDDSEITISTKFEFHGKKLNEAQTHALLKKTASEILGKSVKIVVRVGN